MHPEHHEVALSSSDSRLVEGFAWAKAQALAYVSIGDPVGDWYEAALPGRQAFCIARRGAPEHRRTGARTGALHP